MSSDNGKPAVRIEGLSKSFRRGDGSISVFEGLDLTIEQGSFVSIIGPSGCGKSTLLRLIAGLVDADTGTVSIGGGTPAQARKNKRFGLVPQSPALLPWKTVHENVAMLGEFNPGGGQPISDVSTIIDQVGLSAVANSLPQELSGGMQQRVALGRAFAIRPPVLLMDEPFSALDEISRSDMRYLLLELWRDTNATVIFVTHNIDEAIVLSDRVIVLDAEPATVAAIEDIDLDRPRSAGIEDSPGFHAHAAALRSALFGVATR